MAALSSKFQMPWWHEQPTGESPNNTQDLWNTRHECNLHMGIGGTNRSWSLSGCNAMKDCVPLSLPQFICWNYNSQAGGILSMAFGFPDSSVAEESACNAGDPHSIPGSGRSAGEGIEYPLWYCWASLVAQLVKNLPAMQETWVQSLGREDSLEKGKGYPLAWRIPWTV